MQILPYNDAKNNFKDIMDTAIHDSTPVVIARDNNEAVVVINAAEWFSIKETMHLLSTPTNASRLHNAINSLSAKN